MLRRRPKPEPGVGLDRATDYLPADAVIVEAGAASGHDAVRLAQLFPYGHIHAVEPEPGAYAELRERVAASPNVTTWQLALGATDGTATLNVSSGPYGSTASSLLTPKEHLVEMPDIRFDAENAVTVEKLTLASFAVRAKLERVDLLALDLQGLEYAVLEASSDVASRATVVVSEVYLNEKFAGCGTVIDLQRLLAELGFIVLENDMRWRNAGDLIAVHRRWFERR